MDDNNTNNVKEIKTGGRTRESIRKAIEGELTDSRLKEVRSKLKQLVTELASAKKVVEAKEAEINALFEDYADVLPE
jgi:hypothetical protein